MKWQEYVKKRLAFLRKAADVARRYRHLKALLTLRKAIQLADRRHRLTGERFYVMPWGKRLYTICRRELKRAKLKKIINPNARVFDLDRECFYATTYADETTGKYSQEVLKLKRRQWIDYCDRQYAKKKK